jgi:Zinc carboxypeptidase
VSPPRRERARRRSVNSLRAAAREPPGPFPDVYAPGDEYTVPGERDGTSTFPTVRYRQLQPKQPGVMDFEHFHSEAEMNWWMRKWAYEHPDIVELDQLGTSFGGKPLLQLTITNKVFGEATDKPAAYFDGGRHSGGSRRPRARCTWRGS